MLETSRRQFLGAGVAVLAGSALTACASGASSGSATAGKSDQSITFIHAAASPLLLWAVTYLAQEKGFYKDEGLTVHRAYLSSGPTAMAALLSGSGNVDLSSPGELLAAVAKGQQMHTLMAYTNSNPAFFVVSHDFASKAGVTSSSPLQQRKDALKQSGQKYGISAPGSQTDALVRLALQQVGINPDTQAQLVPLGSQADNLAALSKGEIDGFLAVSPAAEEAELKFGAVLLLANSLGEIQGGKILQGQAFEATAADVASNAKLYQSAVAADVRALKMLVEEPEEAKSVLRSTVFASMDASIWPQVWTHTSASWGSPYVTTSGLAAWITNGLVSGVKTASGVDLSKIINTTFADSAVKSLGWTPAG